MALGGGGSRVFFSLSTLRPVCCGDGFTQGRGERAFFCSTVDWNQEHTMQVTLAEVERIAALAKLGFSPEEQARFTAEFNQMLAYFAQLDELDLAGVPPATHPLDSGAPLRADEVAPSLTREEALRNAPAAHDGFFSVPRVIGGQDDNALRPPPAALSASPESEEAGMNADTRRGGRTQ